MCQNVQSQPNMGKHYFAPLCASVANQEEKNNLSVSSWSQTKIMSVQPALWCFVHEGGKLENRQFVAKMHQIAQNRALNFNFFQDPISWVGGHSLPDPFPRGICAVLNIFLKYPDPNRGWVSLEFERKIVVG